METRAWRGLVPFGLVPVSLLAAVLTGQLAPEPHGHWVGHLTNAVVAIVQLAIIGIAAVAVLGRLNVGLMLLLAAVSAGLVMQAIGNLRVTDSIWRTPYGDEEVWAPEVADDALVSGHHLADRADLIVWIAGFAFVIAMGLFRRLKLTEVVPATSLAVIPPFIWAAPGVVLALAFLIRQRWIASPGPGRKETSTSAA
jgi:hypothetical protein